MKKIIFASLILTSAIALAILPPTDRIFVDNLTWTNDVEGCSLESIYMSFDESANNTVSIELITGGNTNILLEGTSATMLSAYWNSDGALTLMRKGDLVQIRNTDSTRAKARINRKELP